MSFSSPYLLYAQNQSFVQGKDARPKVLPSYNQMGCFFLILTPFLIATVFLIIVTGKMFYEQVLLKDAQQVYGIVTDRYSRSDSDGTTYYLVYSYQVDGKIYTNNQSVSRSSYREYQVDQSILVKYAKRDVYISEIAGSSNVGLAIFFSIFTIIWTLFVGFMSYSFIISAIYGNKLRREGRLVWGKIHAVSSHKDSDDDYHIELSVQFTSPNSLQPITDKRSYLVNHLKKSALPDIETVVAIYYANDKLWEVL